MSKCKKVENPCKICLQPVKQKTGLQCQGACESWVHYTCLNYTPGKIRDIKAGVIQVTCPCPDCKTSVPKEIIRDAPFSCNNVMCPANNPPSCDEASCQANEVTASRPPPVPPPGTLMDCGEECKNYLQAVFPSVPSDPCMQGFPVSACNSDAMKPPPPRARTAQMVGNMGGQMGGFGGMEGMGGMGGGGCCGGGGGGGGMMASMSTVEQMCHTVGELTNQINELMKKMKPTGGGGQQKCTQSGPKNLCPKPCFCPGNPARKQ